MICHNMFNVGNWLVGLALRNHIHLACRVCNYRTTLSRETKRSVAKTVQSRECPRAPRSKPLGNDRITSMTSVKTLALCFACSVGKLETTFGVNGSSHGPSTTVRFDASSEHTKSKFFLNENTTRDAGLSLLKMSVLGCRLGYGGVGLRMRCDLG